MPPSPEALQLLSILDQQQCALRDCYSSLASRHPSLDALWKSCETGKRADVKGVAELSQFFMTVEGCPGATREAVARARTSLLSFQRKCERLELPQTSLDCDLDTVVELERSLLPRLVLEVLAPGCEAAKTLSSKLEESSRARQSQLRATLLGRTQFSGLVDAGRVTTAQLRTAHVAARSRGVPVESQLMIEHGISRTELLSSLANFYSVPSYELDRDPPPPARLVTELAGLEKQFSRHNYAPVARTASGDLSIAVTDPSNLVQRDMIASQLPGEEVSLCVATADDIRRVLDLYYRPQQPTATLELVPEDDPEVELDADDSEVARLVSRILRDAHRQNASDIHIEPDRDGDVRVRFRIDGELGYGLEFDRALRAAVISRLKILSDLDISEKRKPQSGKLRFETETGDIELRLETYPTISGSEDAALRLLGGARPRPLAEIALSESNLQRFRDVIEQSHGLVLCVGPTGSGKTTTLHSALAHAASDSLKALTVEDPVEITQSFLRQVQVNPRAGLTFATALRSFLRADPDIIMVGEMRDKETATIAVEASLTGHLVLSTLHTNSAPETVTRLLEMGLDPFSFADSLLGVLAQRLVRVLCNRCGRREVMDASARALVAEEYGDAEELFGIVGEKPLSCHAGEGCDQCMGRRFRGRMAVHELLVASDPVRELIYRRSSVGDLRTLAMAEGMRTLRQDGIVKSLLGQTTLEEVRSVCSR